MGQGFTVTPSDLAFILKQIKISERHSAAIEGSDPSIPANPSPTTDPAYCSALLGPGADQIPNAMDSYGLRTVDGSCNNLTPGREKYGATDQPFPRLTTPVFKDAEITPLGFGPPSPTTYKSKTGLVFDSTPRMISNLIVDQTSTNPAAVAAAGFPVRSQAGAKGVVPCTTDPTPAPPATPTTPGMPPGCVPSYQTLEHPERDNEHRSFTSLQLPFHVLRPVLRPRGRPDGQERRNRVRPVER